MATRFEIVLHGKDPVRLRAAGEEALNEVERLEKQLSLYQPASEISHLNARAANESVQASPELFALLKQAKQLSEETGGAFDITIAPLVRCWGFMGGSGKSPNDDELAAARANIGMHLVQLNEADFTVRFAREGVMLDLGAIGKGYAVEKAGEILLESGVVSALIHGGTSTVYAVGHPPDAESWPVAVESPKKDEAAPTSADNPPSVLASIPLQDEALSVSAVWGKFFQSDGRMLGHVLDPRTGMPVEDSVLAAIVLPSATETDALSTALLVSGAASHESIFQLRPRMRTLLVSRAEQGFQFETRGIQLAETE